MCDDMLCKFIPKVFVHGYLNIYAITCIKMRMCNTHIHQHINKYFQT